MSMTGNRKWLVFLALSLALIMVDLDITAVNLALAAIANDLSINLSTAQWIIDGYMIAAAALMALGGRLSNIYGARRVFLWGLILFTIASLGVGLSIGPMSVLVTRIIQGACILISRGNYS
jgi:DHA2 family methylenomycin A resistance protein-like MFS transporter